MQSKETALKSGRDQNNTKSLINTVKARKAWEDIVKP